MSSRREKINLGKKLLWYLIATGVAVGFIFPFYWLIVGSFSSLAQVNAGKMALWPSPVTWNLPLMLEKMRNPTFLTALGNSFQISASTIPRVFVSSLSAFALSRLPGAGKQIVFYFIMATVMIPFAVLYIPYYIMFEKIGWIDTFFPFWIPAFAGDAFFIFLMRQFMLGIPRDLDNAAKMDGCSAWQLFIHIILPLSKPVIAICAVFSFVGYWNSFMTPLIFLSSARKFPLAIADYILAHFVYEIPPWHATMLACLLTTLPLIIVFSVFQNYIKKGVILSGIKG